MEQELRKNWWGRNWKWFVPVGCLGSLVLVAGFVFLLVGSILGLLKSSETYKVAVAEAKAHPSVQHEMGSPIKEGFFVSGNIEVSGPSGQANLSIPISGPRGKGTIYVVAEKTTGQWSFSTLVVEIKETKQRIDLLE